MGYKTKKQIEASKRYKDKIIRYNYKSISINFHQEDLAVLEWIDRIAKKEGRTRSKQIIMLIGLLKKKNEKRLGWS